MPRLDDERADTVRKPIRVVLRNGQEGILTGNVHVVLDNGGGFSYTVPADDIVVAYREVKRK